MNTSQPPSPYNRLLNRHFLLLWQGQTISAIGTSLHQIALLYWLMEVTGSATVMGVVSALAAVPGVILGPIGGAIADRYSRKKLIVWGDAVLGFSLLSLAVAFYWVPAVDVKIALLVLVSVIINIVSAFFRPAVMASLPDLVPLHRLNSANAMNSMASTVSMAFGQAIGGILYRVAGAAGLFLVNGVSYLLSALTEMFIHIPQQVARDQVTFKQLMRIFLSDITDGLRYVWVQKGFRNMIGAMALLNFVTAPTAVLLPILLSKFFDLPPDWFGYLMAAMGVGSVIGMTLAGLFNIDGRARYLWIMCALYAMGGANVVLGVASDPFWFLVANLFAGFFMGITMVTFTTLIQITTPSELRGRVSSVMMTVMMGTMPIAMGLSGILADLVNQNIPLLFICSGIGTGLLVTMLGVNRHFRLYMSQRLTGKPLSS